MEIYFSDITANVKRHLSIIGKRLTDAQGKNLFSNITTSTAEDPIFFQYIKSGGQNVVAALRQMVKEYYYRMSDIGTSIERANVTKVDTLPEISSDIRGKIYELPDGNQYAVMETNSLGITDEDGLVFPIKSISENARMSTDKSPYDIKGQVFINANTGGYLGYGMVANAITVCTKSATGIGTESMTLPEYEERSATIGSYVNLYGSQGYVLTPLGWIATQDYTYNNWKELVPAWFRVDVRNSEDPCIIILLDNERANEDIDSRAKELITTYITLFAVGEYLAMTRPDVAQKYQNDIAGAMQTLVAYVYHKEPPTSTEKDPLSVISTTVE